jgi:hypothetical protein
MDAVVVRSHPAATGDAVFSHSFTSPGVRRLPTDGRETRMRMLGYLADRLVSSIVPKSTAGACPCGDSYYQACPGGCKLCTTSCDCTKTTCGGCTCPDTWC